MLLCRQRGIITSGVIWISALLFVVFGVVEFRSHIQDHVEVCVHVYNILTIIAGGFAFLLLVSSNLCVRRLLLPD